MKILLRIVLVLILFVAVAAGGLAWYVRNADYKSTIESGVAEATGYELTIAGELDVEFFPNLGVTLNDVRLSNPGQRQELMSTSAVVLRVDFRELIGGRILVRELLANDFHVNYYVDADGSSIWQNETLGRNSSGSGNAGGTSNFSDLTIDRISINNTSIDYQDLSAGSRYQIDNFNLESRDTNIAGRPFDVQINFDFENNGMSTPVPMSLQSNVIVDLGSGNINFNNVAYSVTPLLLQGQVTVANLNSNPQFSGNLGAEPFSVPGLMQTFGIVEESAEPGAPGMSGEQMAAFQVQFSGTGSEATVPSLSLSLGEAEIEANGSVRFATDIAPMNVSYSLIGGDIDLTPFLPAGEEQTEAEDQIPAPAQTTPEIDLPLDLLSSMNLLGSMSLASVTVNDMQFSDINLYTNIEDSVLDLELTPVTAFDGTLQGAMRLDASGNTPELSTQFSTSSLNLMQLAPSVSRYNTVTGNLNFESSHTARGNTMSALLDSLSGSTSFAITDNSVDIGLIKQVFTAIAALSPDGASIQQWPDVIRFNEMGGYITLDEGLQVNQKVKLRMDNFDVTGSGGIDLAEGRFSYDLLFTVLGAPFTQTISINERYHDISWPVQCSAAFADALSQYCRPDFTAVRQIFTQIGTEAVRSRLDEVVNDQLPEDIQDTARGLLRNLFDR